MVDQETLIKESLKALLPAERFEHSLRVSEEAGKLARQYSANLSKARVAGLLHDCSRYLDRAGMLKMAQDLGLTISEVERFEPKLLHAELSSRISQSRFGVRDPEILSAIAKHTVGDPDMNTLDKIIYLADHIETERDYNEVAKVRQLAQRDLDEAVIESVTSMIQALIAKGMPVFEKTIQTRNALILNKHGKPTNQ